MEQRLAPWRRTCHAPLHFVATAAAPNEATPSRRSWVVTLSVFARSRFASDRDNGAVWAGKGLSGQFAVGIGGSFGPFRYGVFPAVHWAQNLDFVVADSTVVNHSPYAYPWEETAIDWPQRMGGNASGRMSPGQSFLEVTGLSEAALGISAENIWWGPSKRYPMLLGATSDGFPHIYGRSPSITLGRSVVVGRAVVGRLTESAHFDLDQDNNENLFGALRLEFEFGQLSGLQVAVTSIVRQRWTPDLSFDDLLRLVPTKTSQGRARDGAADGVAAVTFVLPVASVGMRVHGTWGRGDFFVDAEDLLTEPDHNQFWAIGLQQHWRPTEQGPRWSLATEYASSVASATQNGPRTGLMGPSVYRHVGSAQGHTQRGQLLGPSIGPGARATYVSLERTVGSRYTGILMERILWDMDAFRHSVSGLSPDGQDREWLFGGRFGTELNITGVPILRLDAFAGASIRWNRQYVRFTGNLLDYRKREINFWLNLRMAWTPDRGQAQE